MVLTLVPATAWATAGDLSITVKDGGETTATIPYGTENVTFNVAVVEGNDESKANVSVEVTTESGKLPNDWKDPDAVVVGAEAAEVIIDTSKFTVGNYTVTAKAGEADAVKTAEATITVEKATPAYTPTVTTDVKVGDAYPTGGEAEATGTADAKVEGTLAWFTDADCKTAVAKDATFAESDVENGVDLYWQFTPNDADNYETVKAEKAVHFAVTKDETENPDGPTEILKKFAVTIEVPAKDGTPAKVADVKLQDGMEKECVVTSIAWAVADGDELGADAAFEAGKAYKATVVLTANADKKFVQDAAVTVDGAEVSDITVSADAAQNTVTFTATFPAIEDDTPAEKTAVTLAFAPDPTAEQEYNGNALTNPTVKVTNADDNSEINDANPVITWSVKGGAALQAAPKDVGEYTVAASLPADSDYEGEPVTADVAITAKELTITANAVNVPFDPTKTTNREVEVTGTTTDIVSGDAVTVSALKGMIASAYAGTGNVTFDANAKFAISGAAAKNYTVKNDGAPGTVGYTITAIAQKIGAVNGGSVKNDGTTELDLIALLKKAGAVLPETEPEKAVTFTKNADGVTITDGKLTAADTVVAGIVTLAYAISEVDVNNDQTAEYTAVDATDFDIIIIDEKLPTPVFTFAENAVTVPFGGTVENKLTVEKGDLTDEQLTIEWESSDETVATVTEGAVTIVGVGTTTITVKTDVVTGEEAGNHNAAEASYILTVEKAVITLSVDPATQTIKAGGALTTPFTIKAEPADETLYTGGTLTYYLDEVSKGTDVPTEAGAYEVRIVGATAKDGAKYEIKTVNGTLTVEAADTPAPGEELTITPSSVSIASGNVNTAASATFQVSGGTPEYTVEKVNGPEWLNVSIDGDTVTISGTRPATAQADATLTVKITDSTAETPLVKMVAVAVGAVTKPSSGGSSSGGSGGGGGGGSSSVTVPVSGDDKSVEVSAKVSGSTAAIDKIDGLDKVLDGDVDTGVVEIDLTALKKDIDTVKLPAAALEDIAKAAADGDNDVDGLAIKLDSGTVEFDADALEAIADQASGSTIELKLEKSSANGLNSSQKDAVKDMDIHGYFDLTLNGGKVIVDFKGGKVSVKIPFAVPSGKEAANFVVIYVANDGSVEEMRTNCSGGYISFTTDHFSKYLIAYKAPEPVEPVNETPVAADCDGGSSCPAHKFTDVNTSLWYHKAVDYAITNSLMSGVGENTFSPNANLSRAMLAQILYNLAGRPAAAGASDFNDVAEGMWYTNAIAWAAENGVVSGLGSGKFGPNDNITREQLAVMLYRYAGSPAAGGSLDGFADAGKVSGYAQNGLVWATSNGVMSGKGGGMLDPQGLATRAEVAQMLYNYLNK